MCVCSDNDYLSPEESYQRKGFTCDLHGGGYSCTHPQNLWELEMLWTKQEALLVLFHCIFHLKSGRELNGARVPLRAFNTGRIQPNSGFSAKSPRPSLPPQGQSPRTPRLTCRVVLSALRGLCPASAAPTSLSPQGLSPGHCPASSAPPPRPPPLQARAKPLGLGVQGPDHGPAQAPAQARSSLWPLQQARTRGGFGDSWQDWRPEA